MIKVNHSLITLNVSASKKFHIQTFLPGVWRQNDGTLLSWTPFWKTATADEPSGARAENCGSYCLQDDALAGQWADWICDRPQYYICERGPPNLKFSREENEKNGSFKWTKSTK